MPLILRPGVPVVRRDAATIQVGLTRGRSVCLPADDEVRDLVRALRDGAPTGPLGPRARTALAWLVDAGLALPPEPARPTTELRVARAQFGDDAERRIEARRLRHVGIEADEDWRERLLPLLADAGLEAGSAAGDGAPAVWLVAASGVVGRDTLDRWQRSGAAHLVVAAAEGGIRVGPFVEPGRTACQRCVDAHAAEHDPRWPVVVEQASRAHRSGAVTEPVDPVLATLAAAWAVRDVVRWVEGEQPSTWSATVDLDPMLAPVVTSWRRHPHCGCAWDLPTHLF